VLLYLGFKIIGVQQHGEIPVYHYENPDWYV